MQVGLDVGRNETKIVTSTKREKFRSAIGEARELNLEVTEPYDVEINGKAYFVGNKARESHFERTMRTESKIHLETKLLFLSALGLVTDGEEKINIVTGLPIRQHKPEVKKALNELLVGTHTVKIGDEPRKQIYITDVSVAPEGAGGFWDFCLDNQANYRNSIFQSNKVRTIDLGSRTINYCTVLTTYGQNGTKRQYLEKQSDTLNYGILELLNSSPRPSQEQSEAFVRRIVGDLSNVWLDYNPSLDLVLLVGGGTHLLSKYFKSHYPLIYIAEEPVFANAIGFWKMGVARWGKEQVS